MDDLMRESIRNQNDVALGLNNKLLQTEGKESNVVYSPLGPSCSPSSSPSPPITSTPSPPSLSPSSSPMGSPAVGPACHLQMAFGSTGLSFSSLPSSRWWTLLTRPLSPKSIFRPM
ncbi:unnamed protein product [Prunus armeniaca]|uniref:Uncharacterized protein n=1 Tax=Prunus armeniaca TaxID=36596 RepID=A0A6J5TQP0_PRUAR|nr:unnamed protein product [Prunus armeniaca]